MKNCRLPHFLVLITVLLTVWSCGSDETDPEEPKIIFKFSFDGEQERLGNFGEPALIPENHAAQTPDFQLMGAHYIEFARENDIPAYNGTVVYKSPVTSQGGAEAIDFNQALYGAHGEEFFSIPINEIANGTYQNLRISLSYQKYSIQFRAQNFDLSGTIASFVGANTYIDSYTIDNQSLELQQNKLQGYWAFETDYPGIPVIEGQAPAGSTTVPNPLHQFSPIPVGSCLVTGAFDSPLVISGSETEDIIINCSISINNSFEWIDNNSNGTFEPTEGDQVVDMGVRGLIGKVSS